MLPRSHMNSIESEQQYILKEIYFGGRKRKIMTQNENGPCPLIAVVNGLVLQGRFAFDHDEFKVSSSGVLGAIADKILKEMEKRTESSETIHANVEAALETLQKCSKGLDVNIRFGKVDDFEFTESQALFDILGLKLFHGWIADEGILSVIGNRAYNEITIFATEDTNEARLIKEWLDSNGTQLTFDGIFKLHESLKEGGVAILFRNNHFTTITMHNNTIHGLVTDMGFNSLDALVFETIVDVNQSKSYFTNGRFEEVDEDGIRKCTYGMVEKTSEDTSHDADLAFAMAIEQEEEANAATERRENEMTTRNQSDRGHPSLQKNRRGDRGPAHKQPKHDKKESETTNIFCCNGSYTFSEDLCYRSLERIPLFGFFT
ncbi:hypothetical protein PFISCL1PPCAC_15474 [Pristionchus fissidentatus]|uniref:Ubiquitin carboxyl-terminal hydrolase n=1 Tax=Pristionchus fissidentatus TaxID=1538716 RepID=A0AAV5W237_9BILA|nr:hypothetical protein PFISCL1PPCAC_15474 [Pristionchus fissidentatus]